MPPKKPATAEFPSVDAALDTHLPADVLSEVKRILYGRPVDTVAVPKAEAAGKADDFEVKACVLVSGFWGGAGFGLLFGPFFVVFFFFLVFGTAPLGICFFFCLFVG
jgi:hypothetical protein